MKEEIRQILKSFWGYDNFRPLQEDIILSVLNKNDTLALLPTGGGKSICFQVPGLALEDGMTLVISPLIALMQDQVSNLLKRNIPAAAITFSLSKNEISKIIDNAIEGHYKFLYVSPERLDTEAFQSVLPELKISLLAVDEAHCISQWGYDFRPSYLKIAELKKHLYNPNIPTIALTASATEKVIQDIIEKLELKSPNVFKQSFERKNLRYVVLYEHNKIGRILKIIQNVGGAGIIYVRSRAKTKEIAEELQNRNIKADYFHAGLTAEEKYFKQVKFINNEYQVMVATNAFGMGIDKPDVRYVIHYELSDSLESYFQEAGRGGRDLKTSYAVLLYNESDIEKLLLQYEQSFPPLDEIKKIYNHICNYFELPIDEGEGDVYDFPMKEIAELYKIPLTILHYSVKFLEMFGLLSVEEELNHYSRCCIHYSKVDIYNFYLRHPEFEEIIKTLLRSYAGILGNYVEIDEKQIARAIKRDKNYVIQQLSKLDKEGVLEYQPMTGHPKIIFHKDRLPLSKLKFDEEKYHFLKERRKYLTEKMIEYAEQKFICRQQFLLNYFDENRELFCGYCDVCLEKKRLKTIESIKEKIIEFLQNSNQEISIEELYNKFSNYSKENVLQAIRELIDDNVLINNNDNLQFNKTK
jgi:ATP-dependent DNA helicase RecQ